MLTEPSIALVSECQLSKIKSEWSEEGSCSWDNAIKEFGEFVKYDKVSIGVCFEFRSAGV